MSEKKETSLKDRLVIPIIVGLLVTIVGTIVKDHYPSIWNWIASQLKSLWNLTTAPYPIPGWLILLSSFFLIKAFLKRLKQILTYTETPSYYDYTKDIFFGAVWKWKYIDNTISQLTVYCPRCDMSLIPYYDRILRTTELHCDNCSFHTEEYREDIIHMQNRVENHILRKLRNNEWQPAKSMLEQTNQNPQAPHKNRRLR